MSSEWFCTKLSSLGTFERGKSKHRPRDAAHLYNGPYPFIQTGDITASGGKITTYRQTYSEAGLAQSKLWPKNTLAITIAANIAETALLSFPACFPDSVVGFTAHPEKADVRFIEYLFRAIRESVKRRAYGSVQENINLMVLRDLEFPVPSLEVQKKIADFLSLLDDRIALLRETNKTLEAIAQAIFKSWFVDFDPVRAKQEGREPEGMDAETAALFPDSFEESELGLIPKGWEVKMIGEVSEILNGYAFKSEDYVNEDDGVFVLRTTNFSDSGFAIRLDKDVFLPKPFLRTHEKYLCEPFDFHLVMVGASVGRTSTLLPHMLPALRNQNMWCFRAKNGFLSKFFIHEMVKNLTVEALRSTSGSAREFLTKGIFVKKSIIIPSQKLISIFEDKVSTLKNKIAVNENQSILLMGIRDTMLPRLISGQLRLPDAESMVEEATA